MAKENVYVPVRGVLSQSSTGEYSYAVVSGFGNPEYHGDMPDGMVPPQELSSVCNPSEAYNRNMAHVVRSLNTGFVKLDQVELGTGTIDGCVESSMGSPSPTQTRYHQRAAQCGF